MTSDQDSKCGGGESGVGETDFLDFLGQIPTVAPIYEGVQREVAEKMRSRERRSDEPPPSFLTTRAFLERSSSDPGD